jgi:transcriptional regulator with XRE-family HTH domain
MKSAVYLCALKLHTGIESDNGIAKLLGVSRAYIGTVKQERCGFSNEMALKIAGILGIHPAKIFADLAIDRANTPEERLVWREIANTFEPETEGETHAA